MKTNNTKLLGNILVENKIITDEELQDVLKGQKGTSLRIGQLIVKKGLATEKDILYSLAQHYDLECKSELSYNDPDNIFSKIPVYFLKKNKIVPFNIKDKLIQVAIVDALNLLPFDDLKMMYPDYNFEPVLATESEIQKLIHNHFDMVSDSTDQVLDDLEDTQDLEILSTPLSETEDIMDMANEAPIIKLVNTIINQAINDRASDIHIEPYEKELVVRFRIDGILYGMFTPPKKFQPAVISRIKIMANLNIAENRLPQDGRIQIKIGGKDIDIRVSIFPTYYGERVVMRILNKTDMKFDLTTQGFSKQTLTSFEKLIEIPHGVVLVTGPTGSGKSTTLYGVLTQLNTQEVNILTVEDPIEYQLNGVGQMQVKPKIDLTFANGLRSILRQDPDIIMIGEIRDAETAEIAIQSALTGHRVFSTLHTNDAATGVTRLIDMGIEPFLIASSVNGFLAQRLARKICPHCKKGYKPNAKELAELNLKPAQSKGITLYRGAGCPKCLNTGYQGRIGVFELLVISNTIRKLILDKVDASIIKEQAIKEGMITLREDGIQKAIQGITSVEEVLRVC